MNRGNLVKWGKRLLALVMLAAVTGAFFGLPTSFACKAQPAATWMFAAILILTPVLGRFFCETMCPLGILQSVVNRLVHPATHVRRVCTRLPMSPVQRGVRLAVLATCAALVFGGFGALAWAVTPYSIYGKALTGSIVGLVLSAFVLVLAACGKGRIWCNWVCPVGTLFTFLSPRNPFFRHRICPTCGNCRACFAGKDRSAKSRAEKDGGDEGRRMTAEGDGVTRRETLQGMAVLAAVGAMEKTTDGGLAEISLPGVPQRPATILPPGALPRTAFRKRCVACGLCISKCPSKCLKPSVKLRTFGQPELDFREAHCQLGCTQCGAVCPAGAIIRLTKEEKRNTHIGHAIWKKDRCIRETDGVQCTACVRKCPVGAIHLVDGFPVIDKRACLGCGACEHVCPARPLPAIFVKGFDTQRTVRPMSEADLVAEMKALIEKDGYASVAAVDGVIFGKETGHGLAPLFALYSRGLLRRAVVADKVVGRAAAAILVAGGATRVEAVLLSGEAKRFLERHGVAVQGEKIVPKILNRDLTAGCPLESAVEGLDAPDRMIEALKKKIAALPDVVSP